MKKLLLIISVFFIVIGVAGYIAPRHLQTIKALGHNLLLSYDPYDNVGVLDKYFPNSLFFNKYDFFLKKFSTSVQPLFFNNGCPWCCSHVLLQSQVCWMNKPNWANMVSLKHRPFFPGNTTPPFSPELLKKRLKWQMTLCECLYLNSCPQRSRKSHEGLKIIVFIGHTKSGLRT